MCDIDTSEVLECLINAPADAILGAPKFEDKRNLSWVECQDIKSLVDASWLESDTAHPALLFPWWIEAHDPIVSAINHPHRAVGLEGDPRRKDELIRI